MKSEKPALTTNSNRAMSFLCTEYPFLLLFLYLKEYFKSGLIINNKAKAAWCPLCFIHSVLCSRILLFSNLLFKEEHRAAACWRDPD